ncbi:hypothetical protein AUJ14_00230 [Candidatus Micrarchaeota archaeon CG1_02_55_22]|nr:MAG: hypothetical protein AUJ14_00230 [Candidatus Micrarchaeota archaeon CG1_02_55_22]
MLRPPEITTRPQQTSAPDIKVAARRIGELLSNARIGLLAPNGMKTVKPGAHYEFKLVTPDRRAALKAAGLAWAVTPDGNAKIHPDPKGRLPPGIHILIHPERIVLKRVA